MPTAPRILPAFIPASSSDSCPSQRSGAQPASKQPPLLFSEQGSRPCSCSRKGREGKDPASCELWDRAPRAAPLQPAPGHRLARCTSGVTARLIKPQGDVKVPHALILVIFAFQMPSRHSLAITVRAMKKIKNENVIKTRLSPNSPQTPLGSVPAHPMLWGSSRHQQHPTQPGQWLSTTAACLIGICVPRWSQKLT